MPKSGMARTRTDRIADDEPVRVKVESDKERKNFCNGTPVLIVRKKKKVISDYRRGLDVSRKCGYNLIIN